MSDSKNQKIPEINFNPELFNNVFWHLQRSVDNHLIRYIWVYGGSSASKTFSVVQLLVIKMLQGPNENSLILRKFAVDIRDSIYSDFKTVITDWGLAELFTIQQNYIQCKTGSYVRFRGLDDSEKIKGIAGFKRVVLEEISQFDEVDLKQIRKRLRGQSGQQIIGIFNPISEEHWIKVNVFDKEVLTEQECDIGGMWVNASGNLVIMKTNYLDNKYIVGPHFVDQHVIDDFEKDKIDDFDYYNVYGLGNWGRLRTGGEFWKDFNTNLHVKPNESNQLFDPSRPIHMVWDKNVRPYQPCALWQIKIDGPKKYITQFDEIAFPDPRNRVRYVLEAFVAKYPHTLVKGLFVYGDRTAISEDSTKEKGENMFTEIIGALRNYHPTLRMQSVNPSVVQSGKFVNACYRANEGGIHVTIGNNCKKSIHDYQYALEDAEGGLQKKRITDKVTGISYEEFGHFSDCKRYIFTVAFGAEYQTFLKSGKATKITSGKAFSKNIY
jgi:PBSX family phage terminase large subunit